MKFRPLHDRVVVRRIGSEEKTAGGIIIPDTAQEKPQEGEVVSVGPGSEDSDNSGEHRLDFHRSSVPELTVLSRIENSARIIVGHLDDFFEVHSQLSQQFD